MCADRGEPTPEPADQAHIAGLNQRIAQLENDNQALQNRISEMNENIRRVLKTINFVVSEFEPDKPEPTFLTTIAETIRKEFRFSHVAIFTADPHSSTLTKVAHATKYADTVPLGITQSLSEGIVGYCGKQRVALIANDLTPTDVLELTLAPKIKGETPEQRKIPRTRYLARIPDSKSELCSPILIGDSLYGVLNIEEERTKAFSQGILDGLVAVCEHIGNVIEYSRSVKQYIGIQKQKRLIETRLNLVLSMLAELNIPSTAPSDLVSQTLDRVRADVEAQALIRYNVTQDLAGISLELIGMWGSLPTEPQKHCRLTKGENPLADTINRGIPASKLLAAEPTLTTVVGTEIPTFVIVPMRQATASVTGLLMLLNPRGADSAETLSEIERTMTAIANVLATFCALNPA